MQYESYLMHYGIKGMRWGISNSKYYKAVGKKANGNRYTQTSQPYQISSRLSGQTNQQAYYQNAANIAREKVHNDVVNSNKNNQPTKYYNHLTNTYFAIRQNGKDGKLVSNAEDRYGNTIYKDRTYDPSTYEEKATITDEAKNYYGDGKKKSVLGNLLTYSSGQAKINTNQIKKAAQSIGEILNRNISEVKNNDKKVMDAVGSVLKEGFSVASQAARDVIASPFNVITNTLNAVNVDANDKRIESAASFFGSITSSIDKRGKPFGTYRPYGFYAK